MAPSTTTRQPCIVAMGGGGFSMEPENLLLDQFVLGLCEARRPKVCFLPTASGDNDGYIVRFYRAFAAMECSPRHLALFHRTREDLREVLLAQDVIYVGGGNTANMLAIWRIHGVDAILREAWEQGVVLCGLSAGSICWFEGGVTDSFGPGLAGLSDGLGLLAGSHCPHYDGERTRRPTYQGLIAKASLAPGIGADDGAALVYLGTELYEVVSSREHARAWRVGLEADGQVSEEPIVTRFLGATTGVQ
ncbi:MAG: peptidase E [Bradymonadaceae bacterium]|nr:peptidase E [Lujinxingiaceae bacterium]